MAPPRLVLVLALLCARGALADAGVTVATSGGLSPQWDARTYDLQDLWAYQPVKASPVPVVPDSSDNPIDAFIRRKQLDRGIAAASAPADRVTLIRRLSFDLTGLPPSVIEVEAFVKDASPAAYERLVDALLVSPHYGEQQARHWLDVVRYADTSGFSNDFERPNAWRYRDYVIGSFNADKPYDRFVIEQLAGDELDPRNPEMLIAVGYLRMGPWEHTAMTVAAVTRQQWLADVTQSVGVTFLAQGLRCASCHDHKVDPVPTRDYYRIQACFATTHFAERPAAFLASENVAQASQAKSDIERRLKDSRDVVQSLRRKNREAIKQLGASDSAADSNKGEFGLTKGEISTRKIYAKRVDYFERELQRFDPVAFSVYSGPPNDYSSVNPVGVKDATRDDVVPTTRILIGGSLESPGQNVTPGVLSAVHGAKDAGVPETISSRRLALARWIASPQNTLTARVIVNRVWQQHFGKGIVATPNNFGKTGAKPTHAELLDYLATRFVADGWSLKKLHRLIVTSETYRRSGSHPDIAKLVEIDSRNDLLAYFPSRRLAAEEIRDAMLASSGELNTAAGGPGVFPEINWEVAFQPRHIMGSVAPAYQPSRTPAERNRRTIYAFRYRTLPDPMLEVFNRPGSEVSCERRDETTVTPQAFSLLNGAFSNGRALAMASALRKDSKTLEDQIASAFRVYGRAPSEDELRKCAAHVGQLLEHHRANAPAPTLLPQAVARNMVEEMTGEDFNWYEPLDGMKHYQRDLMPSDAEPETRALAELCLVLLNSNEFLYLR